MLLALCLSFILYFFILKYRLRAEERCGITACPGCWRGKLLSRHFSASLLLINRPLRHKDNLLKLPWSSSFTLNSTISSKAIHASPVAAQSKVTLIHPTFPPHSSLKRLPSSLPSHSHSESQPPPCLQALVIKNCFSLRTSLSLSFFPMSPSPLQLSFVFLPAGLLEHHCSLWCQQKAGGGR